MFDFFNKQPVSFLYLLIVLSSILVAAKFIMSLTKVQLAHVKYLSIDGLRGYLACFVFVHHSMTWYFFLKNGTWEDPPSHLYTHLGRLAVIFFFMITGYLFFMKLIDCKKSPIDWRKLYISRVKRLFPLYFFAIIILFILIGVLSYFQLNEPLSNLLIEIFCWITFTVFGNPNINLVLQTNMIVAGVIWTLVFEWLFYFSLPLMGVMFFRAKSSIFYLLFTVIMIGIIIFFLHLRKIGLLIHCYPFLGGIVAAILSQNKNVIKFSKTKIATFIPILCLSVSIYYFKNSENIVSIFLIGISFIIFSCGNTMFGVLTNPVSRFLGQLTYSIYLLHGIILFIVFRFIIGFAKSSTFLPVQFWGIISCSSIFIIALSYLTNTFIETRWIKK